MGVEILEAVDHLSSNRRLTQIPLELQTQVHINAISMAISFQRPWEFNWRT